MQGKKIMPQPHAIGELVLYASELFRIEKIYPMFTDVVSLGNNAAFVEIAHIEQCTRLNLSPEQPDKSHNLD